MEVKSIPDPQRDRLYKKHYIDEKGEKNASVSASKK
jgi:hypothetical protein